MLKRLLAVSAAGLMASAAFGQNVIDQLLEQGPSSGDMYSLNFIGVEPDGDDWNVSDMDIDMVPGTGVSLINPQDNTFGPWQPNFPIGDEVDTFVVGAGNLPTMFPQLATETYDPTGHSDVTWFDTGNTGPEQTLLLARIAFDLTGSGLAGPLIVVEDNEPSTGVKIADVRVRSGSNFQFDPAINPHFWDIYAVPEPASLALLALGGLAAFRRR